MLEFANIVPWLATAPPPEADMRAPSRTPAARKRGKTGEAILALLTTDEWWSTKEVHRRLKAGITANAVHCHLRKLCTAGLVEQRKNDADRLFTSSVYSRKA